MKILAAIMFTLSLATTACLDAPPTEASAELAVENCPVPQAHGLTDWDVTSDACTDPDQYPSCVSLGCSSRPSGTPNIWTPCTTDLCYCGNPAKRCFQ